jgi:signal transduction histidine kinase
MARSLSGPILIVEDDRNTAAGIGLAIVRELIEAHCGKVGAESDAESTRVWFELPLS